MMVISLRRRSNYVRFRDLRRTELAVAAVQRKKVHE